MAPILVPVPPLQGLNNSDPAALVVDHNSYIVTNNKGEHTLLALDDFVQPDAILENKKSDCFENTLGWWCIHATINSSSLDDHIGCKASPGTEDDGVDVSWRFVTAFCQTNCGDVSPNVLGAFCIDSGLHGDFNPSTCCGRNTFYLAFLSPGHPDKCERRLPTWVKPVDLALVQQIDIGIENVNRPDVRAKYRPAFCERKIWRALTGHL
ncbi:hypothetical protein Nepgr_023265 [Nepenthes gracilis]|uniref:Neutral/alkaline non-lysosomal ceramidase N-terminal domain-containing protein n=1 Tax=Nepenthes gracilis TaxID=150966 RepID=A0AAD3T0D4_NEPGR|nr:hypothetical protein Nepgr_023265 [Nepenthes gracilis]